MSNIWSRFWLRSVCLVLIVFATASAAADDVLKFVPDKALGAVVINRIGETNEKVRALALRLQVPPFDVLGTAKLILGLQEGIDEKGSIALAAVPSTPNGVPVAVIFVPATDLAELARQLNAKIDDEGIARLTVADRKLVAAAKGNYAVATEEANQATLQAVIADDKGIADAAPTLAAWRSEVDAYAVTTPAGVKFAQQQIQFGLQVARTQLANQGEPGEAALAGLKMYDGLVAAMDREISHCAVGLRLADDGAVHVLSRTVPLADGTLATTVAKARPSRTSPLAGLPQSPFFAAGGGTFTGTLVRSWMEASYGMMRSYPGWDKLNDAQVQRLTRISLRSLQGVRSMGLLMGISEGEEPLYSRMLMVIKTKDAEAYLNNYESALAEMAKIFADAESPLFSFESERIEVDGLPMIKLAMDMKPFLVAGQAPGAEQMMEAMFGGSHVTAYFATADQTTVVASYVSPAPLVSAVRAIRTGQPPLVDEAGVAQTLAMLPPGAQWVGLISPRGTAAFVSRTMAAVVPPGTAEIPEIPEFPETPPVGFSVLLSPAGLDTALAIPAAVLEAFSEVVRKAIAEQSKPRT